MWSLYVGRPWGINIQDISLSRPPKDMDVIISRIWTPNSDAIERLPDQDMVRLFDPVDTCADANVSLCVMMRQLNMTVYGSHEFQLNAFAWTKFLLVTRIKQYRIKACETSQRV